MSDNAGAERLLKAREAVAAEYKLDISDWRTRRLALLMAAFARAEDQLAANKSAHIGDLLALDKAIQDIRETLQKSEGIAVTVRIVNPAAVECPECKHTFDPKGGAPVRPAQPFRFKCKCGAQTEFNASGPFTDGGNPGVPVEAPAPKPDEKVVPLVTHRPGVSASSFHSAVLNNREIPPLKKEQPAIGADVSPSDTVAGLWRNDRHPYRDRDVVHQLPAVNGKG
jgi:hypothetical protein